MVKAKLSCLSISFFFLELLSNSLEGRKGMSHVDGLTEYFNDYDSGSE